LLSLPPTFEIQRAKVLVLRVTVPIDFYTSPIIIEVEGVDVRFKVSSKAGHKERSRRRSKSETEMGVVPTAADLAQSFLQAQPSSEKKELEDALAAETQDLGASVAVSDSGSDDDGLAYGTGQGLSLPLFLTDFLQGIVDRTQITIRGLNFQLDIELPSDTGAPSPDWVTLQLALGGINVEGITTTHLNEDDPTPKIVPREGKRHVILENIRGFLTSEASAFATLERSPSMPSSVASQSPVVTHRGLSRQPPAMILSHSSHSSSGSSDHSVTDSEILAQSHYDLRDSEDALGIPYDLGNADEELEPEEEPPSSSSTPRASLYQDSFPRSSREPVSRSEIIETEPELWGSDSRVAHFEPYIDDQGSSSFARPAPKALSRPVEEPGSDSEGSASVSSTSSRAEDLTQSHLFTHEDAESMYMSAFSEADADAAAASGRNAMPGSWDTEESPSPEQPQRHRSLTPPFALAPDEPPLPAAEDEHDLSKDESSVLDLAQTPAKPLAQPAEEQPAEEASEHVDVDDGTRPQEPDPAIDEGEAPQDEVPTPRGPTRLVKEIISLASISIYLPSTNHQHLHVEAPDLGRSMGPQLPGAFSVHSVASSSSKPPTQRNVEGSQSIDDSVEVELAPMEVRFDASIGFLLATVISKLLDAFKGQAEATPAKAHTGPTAAGSAMPGVKLMVESISLLFLEKLTGIADTAERSMARQTAEFSPDVLLRADVKKLAATMLATDAEHTETTIDAEKFTFGYASDDIISFDRSVGMFESVMNTFPAAGNDISVKLVRSADDTRCNVDTLPLLVKLDLQRLDETFSWFGGLSSFLSMGSSMTSSASRGATSPVRVTKPRGVRFEAPINPDDQSAAKENKIAVRVNGFHLDLVGKDCSVAVDTSAVKFISREEGIGIQISRSKLSGPYFGNAHGDPPVITNVLNLRLEYISLPQNKDLERLIELITPSKVRFDENGDEIMVDTLLRQRKKGAVLRVTVEQVKVTAWKIQQLDCLPALGEELARLGTVAKYLPEDDRPGLLTLALVKSVDLSLDAGGRFGSVNASLKDVDLGLITIPFLVAVAVDDIAVDRNEIEELVSTEKAPTGGSSQPLPVLMVRMVDSIEPVVKVRLMGLNIEYRVPTVMDILGLTADATPQDFEAGLAASVANLGEHAHAALQGKGNGKGKQVHGDPIPGPSHSADTSRPLHLDLTMKDCSIGLNPLGLPSKLVVALTDAHVDVAPPKDNKLGVVAELRKSSVLLLDDVSLLDSSPSSVPTSRRRPSDASSRQVVQLCSKGYVSICQLSSAKATIALVKDIHGDQHVDVDVRDNFLVIETCADSTQTLITLANALKPPTPPSKEVKYKTSVMPVQDLLASLTSDAFGKAEGEYDFDNDFGMAQEVASETDGGDEEYYGGGSSPLHLDSQYYDEANVQEPLFDAGAMSTTSAGTMTQETADGVLLTSTSCSAHDVAEDSSDDLDIQEDHFGSASVLDGTAHRWNSVKNTYDQPDKAKVARAPLRVCVRDVHVIWNLFDGYDWLRTQDVITKAVQEVEIKALERRSRPTGRGAPEQDFEDEGTVIGDFLFNSIYIGVPGNRDPGQLAQAINNQLNDNATETESVATTAFTHTTVRPGASRHKSKRLKLGRSKYHKITFELKGVNVDLVTFPPGSGETRSSIDVRIKDLDIFDHIHSSTWKKFAMYDQDAGEREMGNSMVHLELLNVQPVQDLAASEIVLKATILPLRLHVDQDALDFITRFFEFKDDSAPVHASPSDVPFIQRAEVNSVPVKLDFKPKRVDYAGLRSGHTTEFMNFLILEEARMVLRHTIIYGVSGFDRLGKMLNDIWMPEIKRNQLPGILAGLAPVRGIVNVGAGVKDLIEIPIKEYKKDGRIFRAVSKGAAAFARTTGTEVVKLGAKLAIGTQYVLQNAEGMLAKDSPTATPISTDWDEDSTDDFADDQERKQISLYADQPTGVIQGLRGAYSSLARDLNMARDAIIAVPGEVMESGNASGAAQAVLRRAPTIIFRPALGVSKAIGQTLLGATNTLDPEHRRRMDAVCLPLLCLYSDIFDRC
jgi:autophagy-related protein 2